MADKVNKVDGGGLRLNSGKPRVDLVPPSSILAIAEVMEAGAKKYAEHNWRRGMDWNICYASCMRHLLKWQAGQDNDDETGLNHLKHALTNIAFLIEYLETCPQLDNRYKLPTVLETDKNSSGDSARTSLSDMTTEEEEAFWKEAVNTQWKKSYEKP